MLTVWGLHGGARVSSSEGGFLPTKLYGKGHLSVKMRGLRGNYTGSRNFFSRFAEVVGELFLPQILIKDFFFFTDRRAIGVALTLIFHLPLFALGRLARLALWGGHQAIRVRLRRYIMATLGHLAS